MPVGASSRTTRSNDEARKNRARYGRFPNPIVKGRDVRRPLWLIARQENGRMEVLTIHPDSDGGTLPIFSHQEEVEMFLWLSAPGAGWRARETTAGELISLLYGLCAGVGKVALDPLPLFGDDTMAGLVSLRPEDFVQSLTDERELRALCQGASGPEAPAGSGFSKFGRRRA